MPQLIKSSNIANNSIKSINFDSALNSSIDSAASVTTTAINANNTAQAANTLIAAQTAQIANLTLAPIITQISPTDTSYNITGDIYANTLNPNITITGSGFKSGAIVVIGANTNALTNIVVDSTTINAQFGTVPAGSYHLYVVNSDSSVALRANGLIASGKGLFLWGANGDGQLGQNDTVYRSSPTQVGSQNEWSSAYTSRGGQAFGIKTNGSLWAWGTNFGRLGLNDTSNRSSPTQVGTNTNWAQIVACDSGAFLAKDSDGYLWSSGSNFYGQLGQNDSGSGADRSSPVQIGNSTDWNLISAGYYNFASIKTDGTLWGWGYNSPGALGLNDRAYRSSPTQVGSDTNWSKVSIGAVSLAVKTNGTLWAWGNNGNGGSGLNDRITRSSPTQVGVLTNWNLVSSTVNASFAIKTDGTLWAWGNNNVGQLGLGNATLRSSPTQVGVLQNWANISEENSSVLAVKTNGTLWSWGNNGNGQSGQNNTIQRNSPVQIGLGVTWDPIKFRGTTNPAAIAL